jgi:hypothetical protein
MNISVDEIRLSVPVAPQPETAHPFVQCPSVFERVRRVGTNYTALLHNVHQVSIFEV